MADATPQGSQPAGQPAGQVTPQPQGQPPVISAEPPPANPPNAQPNAAPPQAAPQPTGQQPGGQPPGGGDDPGVQQTEGGYLVQSEAFKRIKTRSYERGSKNALEEYAKAQGFSSVADMEAKLKGQVPSGNGRAAPRRRRNRGGSRRSPATTTTGGSDMQKPQDPPDAGADGAGDGEPIDTREFQRQIRRLERRLERTEGTNVELTKRARREAQGRRRARRGNDALEAEMIVREAAARTGVRDTDYAMRLLTRHLQGKSVEDLKEFDESKYFEGLRGDHPYLFGEVHQPATTGNGASTAPSAPQPGAVGSGAAQGSQIDVKKMNPQEFREHLANRGLSVPV